MKIGETVYLDLGQIGISKLKVIGETPEYYLLQYDNGKVITWNDDKSITPTNTRNTEVQE